MSTAEWPPSPGISLELARDRARRVKNVRYDLSFTIPELPLDPIEGQAHIRFELTDASAPLFIDFGEAKPNGHIAIPANKLVVGENTFESAFRADSASLHRSPQFLYTLFVPARAHLVFPCFDQPDLKGKFRVKLKLPEGWQAITNSAAETTPISTYLFAFAAGKFQSESVRRKNRTLQMFHRETDQRRLDRNLEAIFDLHITALEWLESFTNIPYPFDKFDFVLIPSFQFSGMEHPGAIYYNASSLLLDESPTENQILNRATLIAHETAHMWFGDLVTIRWFDDVWMKEVFANFMADKILRATFPGIDHDLHFLVSHYPPAYAIDRTAGAHPIRQELTNLADASSLYGATIYHKAPIVMQQLETSIGAARFQEAVRAYLKKYEFGNADWPDLVAILDEHSTLDMLAWSRKWIDAAGKAPIDPNAYGARWIIDWENMLDGQLSAFEFLDRVMEGLAEERAEELVHLMLGYVSQTFWQFLTEQQRTDIAPRLEGCLRQGFEKAPAAFFSTFRAVATTTDSVEFLEQIWSRKEHIPGMFIGEDVETTIALELGVRSVGSGAAILSEQGLRITNPDRRARFEFVAPAASERAEARDDVFQHLLERQNRRHEAWVVEALRYLNHPLRAKAALKYIRPALDLLPEIRRTGDIFFPKNWLDATFSGHNTPGAAGIVRAFLETSTALSSELRRIVLQSADYLFRSSLVQ